ncbi:MAG: hypothetical protein AB1656_16590 [Candidatus Omnitrophota bacterium]
MKTAEEIISEIKELSPEERRIVVDFVESNKEEAFAITRFSSEDMALLDQCEEEAEQGINVSPVLKTTEESIAYLRQFRKAKDGTRLL